MKIIFMGSPQLVCPILESLHKEHHVVLVVTQPDRTKGRGQKITKTPVKEKALELGLPFSQPNNFHNTQWQQMLKECHADIFVIVAFSILPPSIFNIPRLGSINLHFSLLPKYRGAAPVQWAIIKGEEITGISIFLLDQKVDHGKILSQDSLSIHTNDTTESLSQRLTILAIPLLQKTLVALQQGTITPLEQEHIKATKATKLFKENGFINWEQSHTTIYNQIRGMNPFPIAYSFWIDNRKVRIYSAQTNTHCSNTYYVDKPVGTSFMDLNGYLEVICKEGSLTLLNIQLEGKSITSSKSFLNGLQNKEILGFLTKKNSNLRY